VSTVTTPADTHTSFAELALHLYEEPTVPETVDRVLDFARSAVNCSHATVLFVHGRKRIETVASTDPVLAELDGRQMELGEGPDLALAQGGDDVIVRDIGEDVRWPWWASIVTAAGLRSMIGVRLYTSRRTIGSLNLYDVRPDHFTEPDRQVAHVLARHAALALGRVQDSEHLLRAMDSRKLIGQAQGILMERFQLDDDGAFAVLRRYSQNNNMKLHDVARLVVETRHLPGM
jgi:GAF domain-containing protein